MSFRFDATLKELVTGGRGQRDFAAAFGLPSAGPITTVNVDLSTLSAAADVALGFGKPIREIADIEFQSGPDPTLPRRLLLYSADLASPIRCAGSFFGDSAASACRLAQN